MIVKLNCRGNQLFNIIFRGDYLSIAKDVYGKEHCISDKNIKETFRRDSEEHLNYFLEYNSKTT